MSLYPELCQLRSDLLGLCLQRLYLQRSLLLFSYCRTYIFRPWPPFSVTVTMGAANICSREGYLIEWGKAVGVQSLVAASEGDALRSWVEFQRPGHCCALVWLAA